MSELVAVTLAERPELDERASEIADEVWPEYNRHGEITSAHFRRLDTTFPEFQFVLVDQEADRGVASACTIPCRWDGTVDGLPAGIDGVLTDAFALREAGGEPDTLCALAAEVPPAERRAGLSARILLQMRALAARHGLRALIAPLRPTEKVRYPLTPIERYAHWTREDGLPFDAWLRLHVRLGAEILKAEPRSLRITAPVDDWERWTGMAFPDSGEYVFPEGLAPLSVDREAGVARYWEPNIWVRHPVS